MNSPIFDDALVDSMFPVSSFAGVSINQAAPWSSAGITPESIAALRRLLLENHKRFHVFFNDKGFQNHISHHLFAAYSIGAPAHVLQKAFDEHASYQRLAYQSPEPINHENWMKHLGKEDFYNAYMNFFGIEIKEHGLPVTLEKYIFIHDANWGPSQLRMLDRFLSGLFHSMIHVGHGPQFGVDGMAAEGLAQTAVHEPSLQNLFDSSFFTESSKTLTYLSSLTSTPSLSNSTTEQPRQDRVHSFTIVSRMLADDRLKAGAACSQDMNVLSSEVLKNVGGILREYASLWTIAEDEQEIQERVEELNWFVTLLFGVSGWNKSKGFRASFFLAHLVTSNLFLPSILPLLKPKHQIDLMRAYFATSLTWYVAQGRPALDTHGFFQSVTATPKPDSNSNLEPEGNPWYAILAHSIQHPDEHQVKTARALAHGAALYGTRPKGYFAHTELKGAEEIDGTLFVRTGGLFMDALHWNYEVKERAGGVDIGNGWIRAGLGWD
ncbi:unnamed protein product [Rhizoctonia solani]|uniref:Oxidoreductase AflY n=1 Tax=Rhizoctonia solani TaxID=456999 RepID=A0A8H3BYZ2_9AGAM|nr:unnamed protein product [Rhizoctonia solani]